MKLHKQLLLTVLTITMLTSCTRLPVNNNPYSQALPLQKNTPLYSRINPLLKKNKGKSGYYLLKNNLNAFTARIELLRYAKNSIDVQYYLIDDDLTGTLFLKRLLDAADRGVKVRLLIDDLNTKGRDEQFAALDSHPNMEVRAFNPFSNRSFPLLGFLTHFNKINRRMHNKALIVDNLATTVGGRNIGDHYFSASTESEFRDLDLLAIGPISQEVTKIFDTFWNDSFSFPYMSLYKKNKLSLEQVRNSLHAFEAKEINGTYIQHAKASLFTQQLAQGKLPLIWADGHVWSDKPEKVRTKPKDRTWHLSPKIFSLANKSKKTLTIIAPYLIPTDWEEVFRSWRKRGIKVRILTNSLASNDVPIVHSGYSGYRKSLLREGIALYELKPNPALDVGGIRSKSSGLHAKAFVFDNQQMFIGSMNLDQRSLIQNTEMGIIVDDTKLATQLNTLFSDQINIIAYKLELIKDSEGYEHIQWVDITSKGVFHYTKEPHTSLFKRMSVQLFKILPIEDQL